MKDSPNSYKKKLFTEISFKKNIENHIGKMIRYVQVPITIHLICTVGCFHS